MPLVLAACALGLALLAGRTVYAWLIHSPRFVLRGIEFRGHRQPVERLRARVSVPPVTSIFQVSLREVEAALLRDPWVVRAEARRKLPDRLLVEIEERVAAARVELGGLYLVDADGAPFKRAAVARGEAADTPVITGLLRADYLRDPADARARIRSALRLAAHYHARPERPRLGEIHLDELTGVTLYTRDSALALRLGDGSQQVLEERLHGFDRVWAALDDTEKQRATTIYTNGATRPPRVTVSLSGMN